MPPPPPSYSSTSSVTSSIFSAASTISTPGTSVGLATRAPFFANLEQQQPQHAPSFGKAMATTTDPGILYAPTGVPLVPLPSSTPIHSFPAFILGLVHSVEADPGSIASHLHNLAASHAAPATFSAVPEGKPAETDLIVDALLRIAARLKRKEVANDEAAEVEEEDVGPSVEGRTVEEVRKTCDERIKALSLLHAEELHRSQSSHDLEVR